MYVSLFQRHISQDYRTCRQKKKFFHPTVFSKSRIRTPEIKLPTLRKVPARPPARLFAFLTPLAVEIWVYMAGAYFLVSITMWIAARFSPREWREVELCDDCLYEKYAELLCDHLSATTGIGSEDGDDSPGQDADEEIIDFVVDDACAEHGAGCEWERFGDKGSDVLENDFTAGNSFWFAIGSLMQQGSELNAKVQYLFLEADIASWSSKASLETSIAPSG